MPKWWAISWMTVRRTWVMLHHHGDVAHHLAESGGQPVQCRGDHFLETAGFDLDHQPIVPCECKAA
jgi:hypothetical protein